MVSRCKKEEEMGAYAKEMAIRIFKKNRTPKNLPANHKLRFIANRLQSHLSAYCDEESTWGIKWLQDRSRKHSLNNSQLTCIDRDKPGRNRKTAGPLVA